MKSKITLPVDAISVSNKKEIINLIDYINNDLVKRLTELEGKIQKFEFEHSDRKRKKIYLDISEDESENGQNV